MTRMHRREFLSKSRNLGVGAAVGWTILKNAGSARGTPANERSCSGLIGAGGRGSNLAADFVARGRLPVCVHLGLRLRAVCQSGSGAGRETGLRAARRAGLSPGARRQVGRRRDCRHSRSLARAGHDPRLPGGQGCVCGEAAQPQLLGRPQDDRGGAQVQPHRAGGHAEPQRPYCMAARKYIADGKLGKVHFCRIYNQKDWANFPMNPDSDPPSGFDWDRWNGPAPEAQVQLDVPCELASLLALLERRHHQRRHPPDRSGALRPGSRLSHSRSTPPAPASNRARPSRPTLRWPCTTSTTWWSRSN